MTRTFRARVIGIVMVAGVVAATAMATAGASASHPKYSGWAVMNNKGFAAEAKARTSSLSRVRIRFDSGVLVKVEKSSRSQIYAGYTVTASGQQYFGNLVIPPNRGAGRFQLSAEGQPNEVAFRGVTAFLTEGARPVLVISGFPAGTTELTLTTAGPGTAATRLVAPCRDHLRKSTGSMLISLAAGAAQPGLVDNALTCGRARP
ncbi:MAG TPA: hypothetical protein VI318_15295 [Baekduia sp.]